MGSWSKPKPPPKPPPPVRTVAFGVYGHGQPVPNAEVRMDGEPIDWLELTNADGYVAFHNVPVSFQQSHLWVTVDGWHPYEVHLEIPPRNHQFTVALELLAPPVPMLEVIRIEQRRYRAGDRWIVPRFGTEFDAVWLVLNGQLPELQRRLDRWEVARMNGIRFAGMLDWRHADQSPYRVFSPRDAGYWEATDTVCAELAKRRMWPEWAFFCDAQRIVPDPGERRLWSDAAASKCSQNPHWIFQGANEARKNGWSEADDSALLDLVRHVKVVSPQTLVSVSDPIDPDDPAQVATYNDRQRRIRAVANYLVVHPSRMVDHSRWARWIEHLKGAADTADLMDTPVWHDEPTGMSSVWVHERRDNRVTAHVAAQLVGAMTGGYTVLHRADENDGTPGLLEGAIAADIPGSPDYKFYNAGTPGAPVGSFNGYDKVRCLWNGRDGYAVGFGHQMGNVDFHHNRPETALHLERDGEGRNAGEKGIVTLWRIAA